MMWEGFDTSSKDSLFGKNDVVEFTIKAKMKRRWVPTFLSMLEKMRYLGSIGSSRVVGIYADGDGDFQPNFSTPEFEEEEPIESERAVDFLFDAG